MQISHMIQAGEAWFIKFDFMDGDEILDINNIPPKPKYQSEFYNK